MNKTVLGLLIVVGLGLGGCTPPPGPTAALPTAGTTASGTIRIATDPVNGIGDVPFLMTVEELRAQGYTVEVTLLNRPDLVPEVLSRDDADIGHVSVQGAWYAIAKEAEITTILSKVSSIWSIIAKADITSCEDLEGRSVAQGGATGVNSVLFRTYVERTCPDTSPQVVVMGDSPSRAVALLAGEIDAAQLKIEDWVTVARQDPSGFHEFLRYSEEFPDILVSAFAVRRAWAANHPEAVEDFVRVYLTAVRRVYDEPGLLCREAGRQLKLEASVAEASAQAALEQRIWDRNGGLGPESVQGTLDFLISTDALPEGLSAADVIDLAYLNAVLDEIGRQ